MRVGRVSNRLVWSRRLTEPPRPANGGYDINSKGERPEGVEGAIGKPLSSRTKPLAGAEFPCLPSAEGGGPSA